MKKLQAIFVALIVAISMVVAPIASPAQAASRKCFKTFTVNRVCNCQTKICGKGLKGATVKAYAKGKLIGKATVNSSGRYTIKIKKQSSKTCITVKISKKCYYTKSKCVTVKRYTSSTHHHYSNSHHHSGHHC